MRIVKGVLLTPGVTSPEDALTALAVLALVKSQVTGKENDAPLAKDPVGRLELLAEKVLLLI